MLLSLLVCTFDPYSSYCCYWQFDKLAKKHNVYKIETIGDCYVSVTGLPVAQPNLALLMVKFARDCLVKMDKLTRQLDASLGPDTSSLAMRVGIHSGPVTAGVLRGEKARFQLFGDTVNTTARMESNGMKDRIHVSQSTADELIALGKKRWVHARAGKITPKGKGLLQTYWVRPTTDRTKSGLSHHTSNTDGSSAACDDEIAAVEVALAGLAATDEDRENWAGENYRRVRWAADLLGEELRKTIGERPISAPASPDVWDGNMAIPDNAIFWDEELSTSLAAPRENAQEAEGFVR